MLKTKYIFYLVFKVSIFHLRRFDEWQQYTRTPTDKLEFTAVSPMDVVTNGLLCLSVCTYDGKARMQFYHPGSLGLTSRRV